MNSSDPFQALIGQEYIVIVSEPYESAWSTEGSEPRGVGFGVGTWPGKEPCLGIRLRTEVSFGAIASDLVLVTARHEGATILDLRKGDVVHVNIALLKRGHLGERLSDLPSDAVFSVGAGIVARTVPRLELGLPAK